MSEVSALSPSAYRAARTALIQADTKASTPREQSQAERQIGAMTVQEYEAARSEWLDDNRQAVVAPPAPPPQEPPKQAIEMTATEYAATRAAFINGAL